MSLRKCPRCELNYVLDDSEVCSVCYRDIKGEEPRDTMLDFCSACNENPSLPGKDLCLFCLKEMEKADEASGEESENFKKPVELGASEMEEIEIDAKDIPNSELGEIDKELSLEEVLAEEEEMDDSDSETDE